MLRGGVRDVAMAKRCSRTRLAASLVVLVAAAVSAALLLQSQGGQEAEEDVTLTVYRTDFCGCCRLYEDYLRSSGVELRTAVVGPEALERLRRELGIPSEMYSCHTSTLGPYLVEGHVPWEAIEKLVEERPMLDGIALPGMPPGPPGMGGAKTAPLQIYAVRDGSASLWLAL
jgi:hypothetical protein